ncbi:anosmin-1a [Cynoglossus semilaevis]|uniref:anosmin-1a n=1 Tax=Cynoglossus semilaevis TaxID=244447 RepID=UPI0004969A46|nr:anosmin-1-like [Cynoglossus semilaevis]XP_024918567.1 anosmin-1-like [Cynoglossus semilaevis]
MMTMVTGSSGSVWIIFLLGFHVSPRIHDDSSWLKSVSRARCASRCLSLHTVTVTLSVTLQSDVSLGWCQNHKLCAKCLEPCNDSWEMKEGNCRDLCQEAFPKKQWECVTSCEFLQSVMVTKQGSCPAPQRASGFAAACVASCDNDQECSALKRCCFNGCGRTCQTPQDLFKGVPLKTRRRLGFEELSSGHLLVRWSSRFNISAEPVVYILQRRWNFGIQPSEDTATSWQEIAKTTQQDLRVSDIRPGRWYQVRVAAVNAQGTRGFTTPSRHIQSNREPSSPAAPTELRVANMSFGPGRTVSARLQWSMPADLHVPVHYYKVSWSWTAVGRPGSFSLTKRKRTVRGCQVELHSIQSNRSYTVEVRAVSYWGLNKLKGRGTILHFTTQPSMYAHNYT